MWLSWNQIKLYDEKSSRFVSVRGIRKSVYFVKKNLLSHPFGLEGAGNVRSLDILFGHRMNHEKAQKSLNFVKQTFSVILSLNLTVIYTATGYVILGTANRE